uniref:Uncharacterized protein n=1 Tax=Rhizophora mucronata TaxID=61149 RepID=A0A2P2NCC3_RHIMU
MVNYKKMRIMMKIAI